MASAKERRKVARKMREMVIDDVVFFDDIVAEIIGVDYDNDNGCWNRLADLIDPGEDVSMSAYDLLSAEDREALRWVRGHGGLDEVRRDFQDAYNRRSELCAALGIDPDTGWSDAMACMGTRLMPEGMEWPRFEGGEPVTFGCRIDGEPRPVSRVCFVDGKWYVNESHRKHLVRHPMGERVKRPAPKALDSEGVECNAGDAVWWVHNKTGNFRIIRIDKYGKCVIHDDDPDEPCGMTVPSTELTHKRPVFDADGVEIRVGDTVWTDYGEGPWTVTHITTAHALHVYGHSDELGSLDMPPSTLTHRAPVIAADGKPLREGETVYGIGRTQHRFVVRAASDYEEDEPGGRFCVPCIDKDDGDEECWCDPSQLTHERPDSWERLEEDVAGASCPDVYCANHHVDASDTSYELAMARDLVRRARALAGGA